MKSPFLSMTRAFGVATLVITALSVATPEAQARDDRRPGFSFFGKRGTDRHHHDRDHDARRRYFAHPRSTYVVTLGNGYAGRGYYYGPPNSTYYYQGTGVSYYSTRDRVPRQYWGSHGHIHGHRISTEASVQSALARRGYYNGPIDGSIGPGSRAAIARYQRERGLTVTASITPSLLRSLGL